MDKACDRFETLGVKFVKKPNDGETLKSTLYIYRSDLSGVFTCLLLQVK